MWHIILDGLTWFKGREGGRSGAWCRPFRSCLTPRRHTSYSCLDDSVDMTRGTGYGGDSGTCQGQRSQQWCVQNGCCPWS
jgi:hypothetical protein